MIPRTARKLRSLQQSRHDNQGKLFLLFCAVIWNGDWYETCTDFIVVDHFGRRTNGDQLVDEQFIEA